MSEVENDALTGATAAPAPEESAQETPQVSATAETDEQKELPPRDEQGRFQKRINELTRNQWEARREAERLRQENEVLRQHYQQAQRQTEAPDPDVDPKAYIAHLAREEARQIVEAERAQWQQQQAQQQQHEVGQQFAARIDAYAAEHPDFYDALNAVDSILGAHPAVEVIATSEHGAAVTHYLGQHLDEAARIAQLPPLQAAAHIARLEARLSAPKQKPVTAAPAPAPTVGGVSAAPRNPENLGVNEWIAWRNSQLR